MDKLYAARCVSSLDTELWDDDGPDGDDAREIALNHGLFLARTREECVAACVTEFKDDLDVENEWVGEPRVRWEAPKTHPTSGGLSWEAEVTVKALWRGEDGDGPARVEYTLWVSVRELEMGWN